jgi:hypothetical protein
LFLLDDSDKGYGLVTMVERRLSGDPGPDETTVFFVDMHHGTESACVSFFFVTGAFPVASVNHD